MYMQGLAVMICATMVNTQIHRHTDRYGQSF